jgi:hypothetical protein
MSDLADKLRNLGSDLPWEVLNIGWDASEEIDRLRALLIEKTKEETKAHDCSVRLSAENARLRGALEQIASEAVIWVGDDSDAQRAEGWCRVAKTRDDIARAALAEQGENQ